MSKICKKRVHGNDKKKNYLKTLKSALGRSILHYSDRHTCAYQGVRNVSFSKNFAEVFNGWSLIGQDSFPAHIKTLSYQGSHF